MYASKMFSPFVAMASFRKHPGLTPVDPNALNLLDHLGEGAT